MRASWVVALLLGSAPAIAKEEAHHLVLSVADGGDPAEVDRAVMSTRQRLDNAGLHAKVGRRGVQVVIDTGPLDELELGHVEQILTFPARTEFRLASDQSLLLLGQIDDARMTLSSGRVAAVVTLSSRGGRELASHLQAADAHAKISVTIAGKDIIELDRAAIDSRTIRIDCGPEADRAAARRAVELQELFRVGAVTAPLALVR